jgi:cytochrome b561
LRGSAIPPLSATAHSGAALASFTQSAFMPAKSSSAFSNSLSAAPDARSTRFSATAGGICRAVLTILASSQASKPIVGWIATSAYGAPITVFWVFALPPIWREDRAFSDQLFAAHAALGIALAVVICAHVGGALFHHLIRKDRVLMRMLSG